MQNKKVITAKQFLFGLEKYLEKLSGTNAAIKRDLELLLSNPRSSFPPEREAEIAPLKTSLNTPHLREYCQVAIRQRLAILDKAAWDKLPEDMGHYTFSFFLPYELGPLRLVNKKWQKLADNPSYWRGKLVADFYFNENIVQKMMRPAVIYRRFNKFVDRWGVETLTYRLDYKKLRQKLVKRFFANTHEQEFFLRVLDQEELSSLIALLGPNLSANFLGRFLPLLGNLELFRYWIETLNNTPTVAMLSNAITGDSLEIVRYLIQKLEIKPDSNNLTQAFLNGSLQVTRYIVKEHNIQIPLDLRMEAYDCGWLPIVRFMNEECSAQYKYIDINRAGQSGSFPLVKYLLQNKLAKPYAGMIREAAVKGSLRLVKYLLEVVRPPLETNELQVLAAAAARSGSLPLLRYLTIVRALPIYRDILEYAAASGSLAIVRFLIEELKVKPLDPPNLNIAVGSNSIPLVNYIIITFKLTPTIETLNFALDAGCSLSMIRYLVEDLHVQPNLSTLLGFTGSRKISIQNFIRGHLPEPDLPSNEESCSRLILS